jgi:hypothetical protein
MLKGLGSYPRRVREPLKKSPFVSPSPPTLCAGAALKSGRSRRRLRVKPKHCGCAIYWEITRRTPSRLRISFGGPERGRGLGAA